MTAIGNVDAPKRPPPQGHERESTVGKTRFFDTVSQSWQDAVTIDPDRMLENEIVTGPTLLVAKDTRTAIGNCFLSTLLWMNEEELVPGKPYWIKTRAKLLSGTIEKPNHLITTPSSYKVSSLLMSSVEYSNWKSEDHFSDGTYREALIKDIYKQFSDKYDFIMLVLNEEEIPEGINYYGKNIGVSNNVSGIGGGIYDYTSNYGSSGKLKSVMQLSSLGFLQNGPALHELLHNWANYALPTENVNETGSNLVSFSYYGHWGFTGGSTRGQLGGFKQSTLEDLGNNQYAVEVT